MGLMETRRGNRKSGAATRTRSVSLDLTDGSEALDRKLAEAIERIERLRSKAAMAAGSILTLSQ